MESTEQVHIQRLDEMSLEQITAALLAGQVYTVTRKGRHRLVSYRAPPCQRMGGKWWIPVWVAGSATTLHQSQIHRFYVKQRE